MSAWLSALLLGALVGVTASGIFIIFRNHRRQAPAERGAAPARPFASAAVLFVTAMQGLRVYNDPARSLSWYILGVGIVMSAFVLIQTFRRTRQTQ